MIAHKPGSRKGDYRVGDKNFIYGKKEKRNN